MNRPERSTQSRHFLKLTGLFYSKKNCMTDVLNDLLKRLRERKAYLSNGLDITTRITAAHIDNNY